MFANYSTQLAESGNTEIDVDYGHPHEIDR